MRSIFTLFLLAVVAGNVAFAQCPTTTPPSYSASCTAEYFTTMSASGTTVVSTISLTGGTCGGTTFFDDFATQGITVTAGNTVNMSIVRYTTVYTGYLSVYVDWNNDGTYSPTELAGTMITEPSSVLATTYSFPVPLTGLVSGVHLHMRVFISELPTGAPCTANYGQAYEYYIQVNCPVTTITATPSGGTLCGGHAGIPVTAAGAGVGGTYVWSPAGGLSASTGASVVASPTVTTTYTVTGTSAIGCSNTATFTITVNPSPDATVTAGGPLTICRPDSVLFSATVATGVTYQWFDGATSIAGATSASYTDTATSTITLVATNSFGCTDTSAVFAVTVNTPVPVSIVPNRDTAFCNGDSLKFTATAGTGYTYQWYNAGVVIAGAINATYTALTTGTYTCRISIAGLCAISTNQVHVTVHTPNPVITFNGKTFRCGTFVSYQWYRNGIAAGTHDTLNAPGNGVYTVKVTDSFGCTATAPAYNLTHIAVQNVSNTGVISIYPNPASGVVNVEAPVAVRVVITNPAGKIVYSRQAVHVMDISGLAPGIYLVELFDEHGQRLLVQRLIKN